MIFKFIKYLKENNIPYCVTNGYKEIVENIEKNSDNDILFKEKDFKNIDSIVKKFADQNGFYLVQNMHHDLYAKNIFVFNPKNDQFLNLDLYGELSRKGVVFFDEDKIFSTLKTYEGLSILSPEKEFISYLIKKLDKKSLSRISFEYLSKIYSENQSICDQEIAKYFPTRFIDLQKAFQTKCFEIIEKEQNKIINDFYKLKRINLKRIALDVQRVVKRVVRPTGVSIAFLGPDGSGKSTVINGILDKRLPFRRKDYFHLKPLKSTNIKESITVEEPHMMPVYSKSKSYLKLFYFLYQYNIGWFRNILKLKISSSLIIFDRYFDDLLVDNKRYRYGGSVFFAKLVRFLIPTPDIYFILTTDADIIYSRKKEVTFEELQRQVLEYEKLVDNDRYFHINVSKKPEEIVKKINCIIMEKMNERY